MGKHGDQIRRVDFVEVFEAKHDFQHPAVYFSPLNSVLPLPGLDVFLWLIVDSARPKHMERIRQRQSFFGQFVSEMAAWDDSATAFEALPNQAGRLRSTQALYRHLVLYHLSLNRL